MCKKTEIIGGGGGRRVPPIRNPRALYKPQLCIANVFVCFNCAVGKGESRRGEGGGGEIDVTDPGGGGVINGLLLPVLFHCGGIRFRSSIVC